MEAAQELTLLRWDGGVEPEGGGSGAPARCEGRLPRELQRLAEPRLGEKAVLGPSPPCHTS